MKADLVLDVECFNLKHTLECGQCFRWKQIEENTYIGVVLDRVLKITQDKNKLYVCSSKQENLEQVVKEYFDLNYDYKQKEQEIAKIDSNIAESLKYSSGIHILNQPLLETIISYIISANNNIKRISRSVNDLSKKLGTKVIFENEEYYLFPTLEQLQNVTMDLLLSAGVGFRARYLKHNIDLFVQNPKLVLELRSMNLEEAQERLISFMGIGPKVRDCIMLFALGKKEVFPIDVWVKRVMEKIYFKENTSMRTIQEYAKTNFKDDAGLIQQHLFYNIRENNI